MVSFVALLQNTRDERSSDRSHTGLIPLWLTNQDGQLKTLQRQTTTSLIILCLCLTNRPSGLKGAECRRRPPETNTNKHILQLPASHPPTHPHNITDSIVPQTQTETHAHTRTRTYTDTYIQLVQRQTQASAHTHFTFTVSLITR